MDNNKYPDKTKVDKKQKLMRQHRLIQRNRVVAQSNQLSFDDFILLLIVILSLALCNVMSPSF